MKAGSGRASPTSGTPRRPGPGDSVAVARILQARWQLTERASARRASTDELRARLTCRTGATSRGGGHVAGERQPTPAGATGSKRSTRLLLVSATYTLPEQSTATSVGCENAPSPAPRTPHLARKRPSPENCWTRLFSLSTTYTLPAPSVATPVGERNR